jgi:hypothetical protein
VRLKKKPINGFFEDNKQQIEHLQKIKELTRQVALARTTDAAERSRLEAQFAADDLFAN